MLSSDDVFNTAGSSNDGGGDGGGKRKDRTEETNSSSHNNDDDDDDADTLHDRLTIAQVELTLTLQTVQAKRKKVQDIRTQIRSSGWYELDSLLRD